MSPWNAATIKSVAPVGNAVKDFFLRVCFARALYRETVTFQSLGSRAPRRSRGGPRTLGRIHRRPRTPKALYKKCGGVLIVVERLRRKRWLLNAYPGWRSVATRLRCPWALEYNAFGVKKR